MPRFLCAAICATFLSIAGLPAVLAGEQDAGVAPSDAFEILQGGGFVFVMRHASSPHDQSAPVGLSAGCSLGEGRGLDAKGLFQARALGALLHEKGVPILKAYTSRMCRSWDTAVLAAGGAPVEPHDAQMTTDPAAIAAFKKRIEAELAANPGQNIILTSHSNIAPLYGAIVESDEEELPEGLISVVSPPAWNGVDGALFRITPHIEIVSQSVTVE